MAVETPLGQKGLGAGGDSGNIWTGRARLDLWGHSRPAYLKQFQFRHAQRVEGALSRSPTYDTYLTPSFRALSTRDRPRSRVPQQREMQTQ